MLRSRQLAAIMFTDIQGYTALMQQNEAKAIQARDRHRQIFNSTTEKYKGRILQYYGDGTLSIFYSAIDAVKCGIEMQLGFQKDPIIPVRIGIHIGDIVFSEEEIIGDSVNVASRIESLAVPGSVFISHKVYDEIKNQESIQASFLKTFKLKNIENPIKVYAISNEGLIVPNPADIRGKTEPDPTPASERNEPHSSEKPSGGSPAIILATKLFVPPLRPKVVLRPRLIQRLNEGLHRKLTLISAAAGFGKTTLISEWMSGLDRPVAWLSLDAGDSDPTRFLSYLVAALQKVKPNIGNGVLTGLQSPQPPPTESMLTILLNEITVIPDRFFLVLDDYHVIDSREVDRALTFLLEHLPTQMHLVITTREDPPLPLARLRVRGQLTELRATDLRFTPSEAAEFLNEVMGLNLHSDEVTALDIRTEGWIAGLQMAALSMQGRADTTRFIKAFTGSHRFILDYLVEEVLQRQSEDVRSFLLQTSILERLCGALCDSVTEQEGGRDRLEALERANIFVISLDDQREWYRYQHLFADVLKARAMEEHPEKMPILHLRASKWYAQNDSLPDAIHHALAAKDFERAAGLIELAYPVMDGIFQTATWLGWVKALPEELVPVRPVLNLGIAWAFLNNGNLEAAEDYLQVAENWLKLLPDINERSEVISAGMVVVDEKQFRSLPASISTARAYIAQTQQDIPATIKYAQQALDLLPEDDPLQRGISASLLGLAYWASGKLEAAHQSMAEGMDVFRKNGNIVFAVSGTFGLADIRVAQGRIQDAVRTYERVLKIALEKGDPPLVGTADLYLGLGKLHREQGDSERARKYLRKSEELGEQASLPDWQYRFCLAQARMEEDLGEFDNALNYLEKAEQLYSRNPLPNDRPIPALKTRVWIAQGRLTEALAWVREQNFSVQDDLSYLREFEYITFARVLIADYKRNHLDSTLQEAMELLKLLLKAAEEGDRNRSVIEILNLQALTYEAQNNIQSALISLKKALTLAEPENYVRIFVDEGMPMARLLSKVAAQGLMPDYTQKLLSAFEDGEQKVEGKPILSPTSRTQTLIEPLSERELEVLQLIAQGYSNREISERLFLALSTVKGHNQNIFGKLEVQRRTEAVARARELGILHF